MFLLLPLLLFVIIFSHQKESESIYRPSETVVIDSSLPFSFPPKSISELDRLESRVRSGSVFPEWFISQTLSKFESAFNDTPPIISLPSDHWTQGTHICNHSTHIIGDLDGNLTSLLTILREAGLPSDTNHLVFLGNMTGNLPTSLETLLLLFSLKLEHPSSVVLILGRNEHSAISPTNSTDNLRFFSKYAGNSTAETQHSPSALSDQLSAALTTLPLGLVIERLAPNEHLRMDLGRIFEIDKTVGGVFNSHSFYSADLSQSLLLVHSGFPITDSTETDFKKLQLKDLNTTEMRKTLLGMRRNGTGMEGKEEQDRLSFISQVLRNKPRKPSRLFRLKTKISPFRPSPISWCDDIKSKMKKRENEISTLKRQDTNTPAFYNNAAQTNNFLETNNLSLLIRADESLPSGYFLSHSVSIVSIGATSTARGTPRHCFLSLTFREDSSSQNASDSVYRPVLIARRLFVDEGVKMDLPLTHQDL
ncbi:hypothetical protein BLNAU_1115 [Blattamonas nauphoetae]|uniref:protein-serine/threonine phosphatase n=1 Tax=Blattamonas nauphoetae TaxID=2049346 RepID=A0ABQ9YJU1_9EUKA|nr:hypothetical protein BLNAU_1115 [Blattamonas nauphoetae]